MNKIRDNQLTLRRARLLLAEEPEMYGNDLQAAWRAVRAAEDGEPHPEVNMSERPPQGRQQPPSTFEEYRSRIWLRAQALMSEGVSAREAIFRADREAEGAHRETGERQFSERAQAVRDRGADVRSLAEATLDREDLMGVRPGETERQRYERIKQAVKDAGRIIGDDR